MSANTKIEWCDSTFNPWIGCTRVSTADTGGGGCDGCYAAISTPARTMGIVWGAKSPRHRTAPATWAQPVKWNREHDKFFAEHGRRRRVFCASLADVFDNEVDLNWIRDLFDLIRATPHLEWLLLTKRVGNVERLYGECHMDPPDGGSGYPWPANATLGITVVNQKEADRDIPKALAVKKLYGIPRLFLSMEPLLGPVNLRHLNEDRETNEVDCLKPYTWDQEVEQWRGTTDQWEEEFEDHYGQHPNGLTGPMHAGIDWVIVGGESGQGARPMHPDWARSLRDQCVAAGVPFLFKQWGEWALAVDDDLPTRYGSDACTLFQCMCSNGFVGQMEIGSALLHKPTTWPKCFPGGDGDSSCTIVTVHRVGKNAAGRLLDGRTWDGFPS